MTEDKHLIQLYSQQILALAAAIPRTERLESPDSTAKIRSPLCGSTVTVDLILKDGRISEFGQDVKACALGQAAASVVGSNALGRTRQEIVLARAELRSMLKEDGPAPSPPFDALSVLRPAKDYKNRHASIMLSLDATLAAFDHALEPAARKSEHLAEVE